MMDWQERTRLLVGDQGIANLQQATVAVIGLGGVGAYAAEMLARAGVGRMIILDADRVSLSNKNRQLLATDPNLDRLKTEVMQERLMSINAELKIDARTEFLTEENVATVLQDLCNLPRESFFLVDAIDTLAPKIALIQFCVQHQLPLVSSMGAGAKRDATQIRIADLSKSRNCPLAYMLRKRLRKVGIHKGFQVVYSEELPEREAIVPTENERNKKSQVGTLSYLPAVFGCVCAQAAIAHLLP
ncbi:MAG: tRNA threonylcarbamoyladenosine dehydratase [Bacteroidales bacterium]|nr:tRNA threonylcarbamoyladenosine dehydratase [Bacteroidales bacterium]